MQVCYIYIYGYIDITYTVLLLNFNTLPETNKCGNLVSKKNLSGSADDFRRLLIILVNVPQHLQVQNIQLESKRDATSEESLIQNVNGSCFGIKYKKSGFIKE